MAKTAKKTRAGKPSGGDYYYAGGERVELTPADDLLAIDERSLASVKLPKDVREAVEKSARPLTGGVKLIERAALGDHAASLNALKNAHAVHPVFRSHGAIVVVLPEVRIEESRGAKQQRLEGWLESHAADAVVESRDGDGRVTLRPASGRGSDALALANALAEEVKPEMAQARFVRLTPRPATLLRE